jgi:hypothetical protein
MKQVLLLAEAVNDLEAARDFYDSRENGAGEYCVESLLEDVQKLYKLHGIHRLQFGCHRMLATRFPFGIYYRESGLEVQVIAILDLRRDPGWIFHQITSRLD